jgi:hypothetical protein
VSCFWSLGRQWDAALAGVGSGCLDGGAVDQSRARPWVRCVEDGGSGGGMGGCSRARSGLKPVSGGG